MMTISQRQSPRSYLESIVSRTKKFTVPELLDLYAVYDDLIVRYVFCGLLYPHTRFGKAWFADQVRDLVAGTDRNRLILTSRARKFSEEESTVVNTSQVKPKSVAFVAGAVALLPALHKETVEMTPETIRSLGVSRLVLDDLGLYAATLLEPYPMLMAEYTQALCTGDHLAALELNARLVAIEEEVGVPRQKAWYVAISIRALYDQLAKMIQRVSLAYARLLYRFSYQYRGLTSTEENFSAGYQGLVNAVRNYDPRDGSSFTSHCQWWVRSSVLQRQRQSSVIQLPTTTWHQLSRAERSDDVSDDRKSTLQERAALFYTSTAKNKQSDDDNDVYDAYGVVVTSPEAEVVLGSSLRRTQESTEIWHEQESDSDIRALLVDAMTIVAETDVASLFPFLLYCFNAGIDTSLLADVMSVAPPPTVGLRLA